MALPSSPNSDYSDDAMVHLDPQKQFQRFPLFLQQLLHELDNLPKTIDPDLLYRIGPLIQAEKLVKDGETSLLTLCGNHFNSKRKRRYTRLRAAWENFLLRSQPSPINPYENLPAYVQNSVLPSLPWFPYIVEKVSKASKASKISKASVSPTKAGTVATATVHTKTITNAKGGTTIRLPDNVRKLQKIKRIDMASFKKQVRQCTYRRAQALWPCG